MRWLLAIDPGTDQGWADFGGDGRLRACGVGPVSAEGIPPAEVIVERPQVYAARLAKGNPNDLITLAIRVGRLVERYESRGSTVTLVLPTTWKGQVPKPVHHKRILAALDAGERAIVDACLTGIPASKQHNALDAIGLGLWKWRKK